MKQFFFYSGLAMAGIAVYDQSALLVNGQLGTATLPFIWQGTVAQYVPEIWLAIVGLIFVLIGVFL